MKSTFWQRLRGRKWRIEKLRQEILQYFQQLPPESLNTEIHEALHYIRRKGLHVFPYAFQEEYNPESEIITRDPATGLLFAEWEGHSLYYKKCSSPAKAARYFNGLRMEQDPRSHHCYLHADFNVRPGDVVLDVGAAEGNFALSAAVPASQLFIFEPGPEWILPLQSTFHPWHEKTHLVPKLVSDHTSGDFIALDDWRKPDQKVDFIKIDVEGAEMQVLNGARQLIERQKNLRIAVCAYHRQEDQHALTAFLESMGFTCSLSPGYMIFHYGRDNVMQPPYLRKGVIRAVKG